MAEKKVLEVRRDVAPHWVGDGFPVRSFFTYQEAPETLSPFLMLDYAGPTEFSPSQQRRGVDVHPHKGFETVTIVYQGELEHRDSGGNQGAIGPGDVQWMTAGSGVVHEEYHSEAFTRRGGVLEIVQLWVNLPAAAKKEPPRYQEILGRDVPVARLEDEAGTARIIAGEYRGVKGPARTVTPVDLWDLRLAAGRSTRLNSPEGHAAILLVRKGAVTINGSTSARGVALVVCDRAGDGLDVACDEDATVLFLGGALIDEPVVGHGPFVMNTSEEIRQAIVDYRSGRMGAL